MNLNEVAGTQSCVKSITATTPEEVKNRPGLSAIGYRIGTYNSFRESMIRQISTKRLSSKEPPNLQDWTDRESDDYGIAFIEMWAYIEDILTFYQERIANEAYLRTALLPESVRRLANFLDYKPFPGVAATALLAFTTEKDKSVQIPLKLKVQSVPGENEKPQKFETIETVNAQYNLNQIKILPRPKTTDPFTGSSAILDPAIDAQTISQLAPGDKFVIFTEDGHIEEKQIKSLQQTGEGLTRIDWEPAIQLTEVKNPRLFKFSRKLRLFGLNAPKSYQKPKIEKGSNEWNNVWHNVISNFKVPKNSRLNLDSIYDDLNAGTEILVKANNFFALTKIANIRQSHASVGPLRATITAIDVDPPINRSLDLRKIEIYILGPEIKFWDKLYPLEISGDNFFVEIDILDKIESKRSLLLDDETNDPHKAIATSSFYVDLDGDGIPEYLQVNFSPPLKRSLDAKSAKLWGNIAMATHGETIDKEVLGDGDASVSFQSFTLAKDHVTFIPQEGSPRGVANSLKVYVDGIEWKEVRNFIGLDEWSQVYLTEIDENQKMIVQFGDGTKSARPASGRGNIIATYRQGLGKSGNVGAGKLKTLLNKPLDLKGVENPGKAFGGADPETRDSIKKNAPNTVRTFDRIISLKDFEDAAREFAGIAKARSSWKWDGEEQVVDLVVACNDNIDLDEDVKSRLISYLNYRRDTNQRVLVAGRNEKPVVIEAVIKVDPRHIKEDVKSQVIESLKNYFSFDNMNLGSSVHLSEVYSVIQSVDGVNAALISNLQFKSSPAKANSVLKHLHVLPGELIAIEDTVNDIKVNFGVIS